MDNQQTYCMSMALHVRCFPFSCQARYRFEGESFPSIRELLEYYRDTQVAVTRRTPAVIVNPVSKVKQEGEKWSLRHEEIELGKQLGKGTVGFPYTGHSEIGTSL